MLHAPPCGGAPDHIGWSASAREACRRRSAGGLEARRGIGAGPARARPLGSVRASNPSQPGGAMTRISITVDGVRYDDDVEPRTLLVHHLREQLGKVGTVVGGDTRNCGACSVLLDGQAVESCSMICVE